MKRIMFVVMVVLLALGKVYASEDPNIKIGITNSNTSTNTNSNSNTNTNSNSNNNHNKANAAANYTDNSRSVGSILQPYNNGAYLPNTGLVTYGETLSGMSVATLMSKCQVWTGKNFDTMVKAMGKKGIKWEDLKEQVAEYPYIMNQEGLSKLGRDSEIIFMDAETLANLESKGAGVTFIGGSSFSLTNERKQKLPANYLNLFAYTSAVENRANVVVYVKQYNEKSLDSEASQYGGGLSASWISKAVTWLIGAEINGSKSRGRNMESSSPGETYSYWRIDNFQISMCYEQPIISQEPKKEEPKAEEPKYACNPEVFNKQIYHLEHEIKWCLWPCHNNQMLRFCKANVLLDKYFCEGQKDRQLLLRALHEYEIARRDFNNGRELAPGQKFGDKPKGIATTKLPQAKELDCKVRYNMALVIRLVNGRDAAMRFAQKNGLKAIPTCYEDLKR